MRERNITFAQLVLNVGAMNSDTMTRADAYDMLEVCHTYLNRSAVVLQKNSYTKFIADNELSEAWLKTVNACKHLEPFL